MSKLEKFRMYFLVPYNLSPIQQGIQCGHAALEYASRYSEDDDFKRFVKYDKTWIVLNGGVSNHYFHDMHSDGKPLHTGWHKVNFDENDPMSIGSMEQHWNFLQENGIKSVHFIEPDANNMMTSICFLVPEQIFNKKDYPDFPDWVKTNETIDVVERVKFREIYYSIEEHEDVIESYKKHFNSWCNTLGGPKYGNLRVFLNQFRLA
jgi:hypothetical protein